MEDAIALIMHNNSNNSNSNNNISVSDNRSNNEGNDPRLQAGLHMDQTRAVDLAVLSSYCH